MKIIQVNVVNNHGSTGKIMYDIHKNLISNGYEARICYGVGAVSNDLDTYKFCNEFERKFNAIISRITGIPFGGAYRSTSKLVSYIEKEKPDIVHLHCINGYTVNIYKLLKYLGTKKIKTLLTLHAEFFYTGGCGHSFECNKWKTGCYKCPVFRTELKSFIFDNTSSAWRKMRQAFGYFDKTSIQITAVSPWLKSRAKESKNLNRFDINVILNGVDTNIFKPVSPENEFVKLFPQKNFTKIILHVTANFSLNQNDIKGGRYIEELAELRPNDLFIIVANNISNLHQLPTNIFIWGRAKNQKELAKLYSIADLTVITSKRETFSMVTAESLCCGTPVVGFKAGGPESIALEDYTEFVEYGDINALNLSISNIMVNNKDIARISMEAKKIYSSEIMSNNYIKAYDKLLIK